jgi:two-component system, sensor histidine kinase YesM
LHMKRLQLRFPTIRIHSIGHKMIVYFSVLFLVVMTSIGAITYRIFSSSSESQTFLDTQKIIEQTMINVDFYFNDIKTPMVMLAQNPTVLRAFKDYSVVNWPERLTMRRELQGYTSNINSFKSYIKDIILVGRNGFKYNINSVSELSTNFQFDQAPWLRNIMESHSQGIQYITTHSSDYYFGALSKDKVVSAVLNVRDNGEDIGYVICDIDLQEMNKIFNSLSLGKGGYIYMLDSSGTIIFHPQENRIHEKMDADFIRGLSGNASGSFRYRTKSNDDFIVYAKSQATGWILAGSIPYSSITEKARSLRNLTYLLVALSSISIILIAILISNQITRPIKQLIDRIKKVQIHDFNVKQVNYGQGEIAIIGQRFEQMVFEINKLINDVYLSNLKQKETELKVLQSQINPHFLYNSLQLIKAEAVFGHTKEVSEIVTALGDILRYPLHQQDALVPLEEEIQYVKSYLEIYKRRFKGKVDFQFQYEPDVLVFTTPKLILQPIVENCIIHGLKNLSHPGMIFIWIEIKDQRLAIQIMDNGEGIPEHKVKEINEMLLSSQPDSSQNIGLINVHQRIKLRFGDPYGIHVESQVGEYTKVTVSLPLSR